jgi:hypothetical protein
MNYWNQPAEPVNWAKTLRAKRPVGSQRARVDKARVTLQKWMVRVAGRRRRNKKMALRRLVPSVVARHIEGYVGMKKK